MSYVTYVLWGGVLKFCSINTKSKLTICSYQSLWMNSLTVCCYSSLLCRLIADRISCYERLRSLRASLEDTWNRSADLKHHRDLEERAFIRWDRQKKRVLKGAEESSNMQDFGPFSMCLYSVYLWHLLPFKPYLNWILIWFTWGGSVIEVINCNAAWICSVHRF